MSDEFDYLDKMVRDNKKEVKKLEKELEKLIEEQRKIQITRNLSNITKRYPEKLVSKIKMTDEIGRDIIENEKYDIFRKSKDE